MALSESAAFNSEFPQIWPHVRNTSAMMPLRSENLGTAKRRFRRNSGKEKKKRKAKKAKKRKKTRAQPGEDFADTPNKERKKKRKKEKRKEKKRKPGQCQAKILQIFKKIEKKRKKNGKRKKKTNLGTANRRFRRYSEKGLLGRARIMLAIR
jgi:hypothetical protein